MKLLLAFCGGVEVQPRAAMAAVQGLENRLNRPATWPINKCAVEKANMKFQDRLRTGHYRGRSAQSIRVPHPGIRRMLLQSCSKCFAMVLAGMDLRASPIARYLRKSNRRITVG